MVAIGGQSGEQAKHAQALDQHFDAAAVLEPAKPAPALALHNYLGQPVNIDSYRGKAVLVTFLYTNCPDICPLITSNLRVALNKLGSTGAPPKCRSSPCQWTRAAIRRRRSRRSSRATA